MPAFDFNPERLSPNKSMLARRAMPGEYDGMTPVQRVKKRHTGNPDSTLPIGVERWKSETLDVKDRTVVLIANTDDIDMQREVVVPGGADWSYFESNRAVFLDHKYDWASMVGMMRTITPEPDRRNIKRWKLNVHILELEGNPHCNDILRVARDFGLGASIGFEGLEGGPPTEEELKRYPRAGALSLEWVTRKWLGLEVSIVPMKCNPGCHSPAQREAEKTNYLDEAVTKGWITRECAVVLGLPTTPKRKLQPVFLTD